MPGSAEAGNGRGCVSHSLSVKASALGHRRLGGCKRRSKAGKGPAEAESRLDTLAPSPWLSLNMTRDTHGSGDVEENYTF